MIRQPANSRTTPFGHTPNQASGKPQTSPAATAPQHIPVATAAPASARPRQHEPFRYASSSYRIRSYAPLLRRRAIFKVA